MKDKGKLFVISGPSGAGKSTVVFKAIEDRDDMCFSVSVTTRKPRPGEVDGKEYFFVDLKRFDEMVANDELLEHAMYVANSYGTPRAYVQEKLDEGKNVILDIEVQGARQINEKMPEAVKIFIIPPSMAELERRLRGRGTDTDRAIEARLIRARQEYGEADFYDYIIINDDAEKAATRALQDRNLTVAMAQEADLLVLDEAGSAWELDMVDKDLFRRAVLQRPAGQECVLTAHAAPQWMLDAADYVTEMKCIRHPYQKGIAARKGVEY